MSLRAKRLTVRLESGDVGKLVILRRGGRVRLVVHDRQDARPLIQAVLTEKEAALVAAAIAKTPGSWRP